MHRAYPRQEIKSKFIRDGKLTGGKTRIHVNALNSTPDPCVQSVSSATHSPNRAVFREIVFEFSARQVRKITTATVN